MRTRQQQVKRADGGRAASQFAGQQAPDAALPRQHAQEQRIVQLRAGAPEPAGVVQLGKGKRERQKKKEAEERKASNKLIDPHNKDLTGEADTAYTGSKLETSEQQGGHARGRHAAKDTAYLDGRNRKIASTFLSEDDQNAALEQLVAANQEEIKTWIAEQYGAARLLISGPIEAVQVAARRKQKQVGVTSSGYEYADPTVARFVDVDVEELDHATAVLERYLIKSQKKGQTPRTGWRVVTCYPHPAGDEDQ